MMFSVLARLLQLITARILIRDQPAFSSSFSSSSSSSLSSSFSSSSIGETGYNNSCLARDAGLNREGPREFNCAQWVIESTDRIWNMYRDFDVVEGYLRQYMTEDWESITVMGEYLQGMDQLIGLVNTTLIAFPDIKLHIVDTFCEGNDIDGYKTTMPVLHTATHTGPHPVFGPPTGRKAVWYGVPNSFIKNIDGQWKYTAEINIPDSMSLYSQLGAEIPKQTWVTPTDDCNQLFDWDSGHINPGLVPHN